MRFQLLGPLRLWQNDAEVDLGPPARRAVLGLLLLAGGEPVARTELVDVLWGDHPPPTAVNVLQTHVKHLRRLLEPGRPTRAQSALLPHLGGGYALRVPESDADLPCFRRLVATAADAVREGNLTRAATVLAEALALWRGEPLADVPVLAGHPKAVALAAERRTAIARYCDVKITLGAAADVLPMLTELAAADPLDEPTHARLITAYHAVGRRSAAFDTYHGARARLADELGVDPGPELVSAHAALLHGAGPATTPERQQAVPAQLPADVPGFTGRAATLSTVDNMAGAGGVVTVSGAAGVGKTALAVHWAHHARHRFPGGQLHADLRGHSAGPAVRPIEVLAQFLPALGVPVDRVPVDLPTAAALYRTLLSGRQVLVLLDNAASAEQVRPLLPGDPGCLVLVTGRERLTGLVALDGARHLPLDVLPPIEAVDLVTHILGTQRVHAEPTAADELVKLCAYLPLALRIAAANLAGLPGRGIAEHVVELREGNPLTTLAVEGDEQAAVRTAFDLSYAALPSDACRALFRFLGLVPGGDVSVAAATALVGTDAGPLLARLANAHLVEQHAKGRFRFHDLLRHYAVEQLRRHNPPAARAAAEERLYDWYLRSVDGAARTLYPHMLRLPVAAGEPFADRAAASAWLDTERGNLVAAVRTGGAPRARWQLADAMRGYFWLCQRQVDWAATAEAALVAAEGEPRAQASARLSLADLRLRQGRYRDAVEHYTHALVLARRTDWSAGHAAVLGNLGIVYWQAGRLSFAATHFARALALSRATGQTAGEAAALGNLGLVCWERGELAQAAAHCAEALTKYQEIGSSYGEAINLGNLGRIRHALGALGDAESLLTSALALHREAGDRYGETDTRTRLAMLLADLGRDADALHEARAALSTAQDIGDPRAETEALHALADVRQGHAPHAEVQALYRRALDRARETGDRYPECDTLIGLATASRDAALATQALAMARRSGYRALEGRALLALAAATHEAGHAREALAIFDETGSEMDRARAADVLTHHDTAAPPS